MPELSVIIPSFNAANFIDTQLESLARQINAPIFEVIVVDNGSNDGTIERVVKWSDRLEIKVLSASEYSGPSYPRNVGAKHAASENLVFVDADDALGAKCLSYCAETFKSFEVFQLPLVPIPSTNFSHGLTYLRSLVDEHEDYIAPEQHQPAIWPILPASGLCIGKKLWDEIGGFDLAMDPGAEDNDLAFRLQDLGYTAPTLHASPVVYRTFDINERNPSVVYRRAVSVARLITSRKLWGTEGTPAEKIGKESHTIIPFFGKNIHEF